MSQASSRKLTTVAASRMYAKRRRKLRRTISNRTLMAVTSFLSKKYGLLPCFCEHDSLRMMTRYQASTLSKSSNAFWHRNSKPKDKLVSKKQQRNNSTASATRQTSSSRSSNFKTLRQSIVQRFKRNKKGKMPTITARSVIRKRTMTNVIKHKNNPDHPSADPSNTMQTSNHGPLSTQSTSQHSSSDSDRLVSQDNSHEYDENNTLEPTIPSFKSEQQNINATNNTSQTIQQTSHTTMNDLDSSRRSKRTTAISQKSPSNTTQRTSSRSTINSPKRKQLSKPKRPSKRKPTLSNKNMISASKRKHSKALLSRPESKTKTKKITSRRSPFPNPNLFHSLPPLQDSEEITKENVHENHLCCKPITSIQGLSISDQKKLIEHNHLTLISLLPIYLSSPGNFPHKIREKTNISDQGALELDRLMNKWGSARLFIGANSHYKTLTQTI